MKFGNLYREASRNGLTKPRAIRGSGIRFINMGELFESDWIGDIETDRVPVTDKEMATALLEEGDLLFARQSLVREGAGKCSIVTSVTEPTTFDSHLIRVRLNQSKANPHFYQYFFSSPLSPMPGIVSQCAQAGIKGNDLATLDVPCPSLGKQNHIASILMAYDNLIENGRRQIALLEEAVQRLYKEWFVDLHFPGYEDVEIINELPANWSKSSLTDCVNVIRGRSYKSSEIEGDEGVALVNLKNLRSFGGWNDGAEKIYSGAFKNEQHVQTGDIIMGVTDMTKERRLVGHVALVPDLGREAIISMDLVKLVPYQMEPLYLYSVLRFSGIAENIALLANGTNVLHLKPQILSSVSIDEPPIEIQADYARHIAPMMNEINLATRTIAWLSEARDRLLPKLMSGEIEVEG